MSIVTFPGHAPLASGLPSVSDDPVVKILTEVMWLKKDLEEHVRIARYLRLSPLREKDYRIASKRRVKRAARRANAIVLKRLYLTPSYGDDPAPYFYVSNREMLTIERRLSDAVDKHNEGVR